MNLLVLLLTAASPAPRPAVLPPDSIGQEFRNGQRLVRHRVAPGETLFALSRRYRVSVEQITAANPQMKAGLAIGEVVLIPRPGPAGKAAPTAAAAPPAKAAPAGPVPARYTVQKGETLFGIARRFGLTPAELLERNNLPADGQVRVGQELLLRAAPAASGPAPVAAAPGPPATPAPRPAAPPDEVPPPRPAEAPTPAPAPRLNPNKPAQIATVTPAPTGERPADTADTRPAPPTRATELLNRKTETGIAGPISGGGTDKYLALHKTAPVGTIMEVKNQMNGQAVFVRVIGALPDTGENENILVRLSPRALQKLGTRDSKFRVETSYVP